MAVRFRVSGRVQGVGFRAYVLRLAEEMNLNGEVWNCRNGDVEGVVVLSADKSQFENALRGGPGHVQNVDLWEGDDEEFDGFRVSYTR
jgi:acylphosphatase